MALANREQLKNFLSDQLVAGEDAVLDLYLEQGAESVKAHSFLVTHPRFAELQLCYTAHLLAVAGLVSRPVTSESVEGVSTSYSGDGSDSSMSSETRYLIEYKRKRAQIQGMSGRIA